MLRSESIDKLSAALVEVQKEIKVALKDKNNPFFKSKYADLNAVWDACREPLSKHGIAIVQLPVKDDRGVGLETLLIHSSGQFIGAAAASPLAKRDPQGVGSALTYLRRYALSAALGVVADEDDDGAAASLQRPSQPRMSIAPRSPRKDDL